MKSATMRYFDSGVISHEIWNNEIFWFLCDISWNLGAILILVLYLMKFEITRYCNSSVISHEICNHDIFWFWCNNSWNLNLWDTEYWAYIYRYDILVQSTQKNWLLLTNSNQSNQSIKTADQSSASFERFRSCFWSSPKRQEWYWYLL